MSRDRRRSNNFDEADDDFIDSDDSDDSDSGGRGGGGRQRISRRRKTIYCPEGKCFDYKDIDALRRYVTETGKIKPRRQTGNCSRCQRELAREVKRARHIALLPFVSGGD